MRFLQITEIPLGNDDELQQFVSITIDVDWASDIVLYDALSLLNKYQVQATILMTHKTDLIDDIRSNPLFEIGIHPNFNFLLEGDFRYGRNYKEVIDYYMNIVPDAKVVRSHSITQNTRILQYLYAVGLKYDLNTEIPFSSGIILKPYQDWTGLIKIPYFWQENISFQLKWKLEPNVFLNHAGLKVFNFHPIHIFLNSENMNRYESLRPALLNEKKLDDYVNRIEYGVRNFFIDLILLCKQGS